MLVLCFINVSESCTWCLLDTSLHLQIRWCQLYLSPSSHIVIVETFTFGTEVSFSVKIQLSEKLYDACIYYGNLSQINTVCSNYKPRSLIVSSLPKCSNYSVDERKIYSNWTKCINRFAKKVQLFLLSGQRMIYR